VNEIRKLDDSTLNLISAGRRRTVLNKDGFDYTYICADPNGKTIAKIYNGESVCTTGRKAVRGGNSWMEVTYADGGRGWIAQKMLVNIEL